MLRHAGAGLLFSSSQKVPESWSALQHCVDLARCVCPNYSSATGSSTPHPSEGTTVDPFTQKLQQKTEEQLRQLTEAPTYAQEGAVEQGPRPGNQPEGEEGGPKGPEPTRYGDWEKAGRCYDF
ncbi:hypothetical protein ACKKBG_A07215 [Auxenochlorella protothecoides x Auxenochlorella symbiontica]